MWLLAACVFAAAKVAVWRATCSATFTPRALCWLLLWPGMDLRAFLSEDAPPRPAVREYLTPLSRIGLGAALVWVGARQAFAFHPLLAGWIGMLGLILMLHFGSFDLLSALWRRAGVYAEPLMRRPSASTSLGEFWGVRWNRGFRDVAHKCIFEPLAPRIGVRGATLAVFAVSGLLHEFVISLPARGGYGLPLGYFLLQGVGTLGQTSRWSRRRGLAKGWRGWLVTLAFTAGPAFWLFHPLFVRRVILPFLKDLHAL